MSKKEPETADPKDSEYRPYPRQPLFHYTSVDVLRQMIESKKVHATNILYMSDSAELEHGLRIIQEVCDEVLPTVTGQEQDIVGQFAEWAKFRNIEGRQFFVCCFTEKDNDINQWRSYTPPKLGVCIGFDGGPLVKRALALGWDFSYCVYERANQKTWAEAILTACRRNGLEQGPEKSTVPHQSYYSLFENNAERVLQVAARLKHPAYAEESEWRLMSPYLRRSRDPRIKFRTGESMLVPYMELDISGEADGMLDILQVTVGPTPHPNPAHYAVANLTSGKIRGGRTSSSGIPYRTW